MDTTRLIKLFLAGFPIFVVIDFIWIGVIAKNFYLEQLGKFTPRILPALLTYVILTLGIILFVLPRVSGRGVLEIFLWGAVFGLLVYGVYDLTNLATLKNWTIKMTIVDMLWGGLVNGLMTVIIAHLNKIIKY